MTIPSSKTLVMIFALSSVSPILTFFIKPIDYSFYMFFPAKPQTVSQEFQLLIANTLLISGFVSSVLSAVIIVFRGIKKSTYVSLLLPMIILFNPLQQPIFFESLDTYLNNQWRIRAFSLDIVGKTPEEIRSLFGQPIRAWTETPRTSDQKGKLIWQAETYTAWEYQPLPIYWFGSYFQIFFVDGKVQNFEANDD